MFKLLLYFLVSAGQKIAQAADISYTQSSSPCINVVSGQYNVIVINANPCYIDFTFNGQIGDNLWIQNTNLRHFQAAALIGTINFYNVTISQDNMSQNQPIQLNASGNIFLSNVTISGFNVLRQDFMIQMTSQIKTVLTDVVFINNICTLTNMLVLNNFHAILTGLQFQYNQIILGSFIMIKEGMSKFHMENILFYRNQVSSAQFFVLNTGSLNKDSFDIYNFCIQQNVIDHVFTDQSRLSLFNLNDDFRNDYFFSDNNLISIKWGENYHMYNTTILDNTIMFQIQVVFIASSLSATRINGLNISNNTLYCLQLTLIKLTNEFDNDMTKINFDSSNTRSPERVLNFGQQYLLFMKFVKSILQVFPAYDQIVSASQSVIKSNYYNQFPIIGIVAQESIKLNISSVNILLNNQTVFQIILSQNQVNILIAGLKDISIIRLSISSQIFDIGAFVITGVFTEFFLTNLTLTNLRMGKRSMILIDSTSYYSIFAPCTIIIQNVNIHDTQVFVLDHSNQISIFQITNNVNQNISIHNLTIKNVEFFSFPQYYAQFQNKTQYMFQNVNFQLDFSPDYFQTPINQILSLYEQTAFLNLQSVYSFVFLSDWDLFNISLQYEKYGIYVISNTFELTNLTCDSITFSKKDINLQNQQLLTFYGTNIILLNIFLNNHQSLINQIAFIEVIGERAFISVKNAKLVDIRSSGGIDDDSRPTFQIQSKATHNLQIEVSQLYINTFQNFNLGGLLSIIQLENSSTFVQLRNISLYGTYFRKSSSIIFLNLVKSFQSYVFFGNLIYSQVLDDLSDNFNFLNLQSIKFLMIQQIFIESSQLQQAFFIIDVAQIILNNIRISQSITNSGKYFIAMNNFTKILFQSIMIDSLVSNNVKIIQFFNPLPNIHSQVYLKDIILKNNVNKVCCADFFYFYNTNVTISKLNAFKNYNFGMIRLNVSQFQIESSYFDQNNVKYHGQIQQKEGTIGALQSLVPISFYHQNGSLINAFQSQVFISNTIFRRSNGSYLGGALYYLVDIDDLLQRFYNLYFGQGVLFAQCFAQYGGAIYHRSLNPLQNFKSVTFVQNMDQNKQFNDIATIPNQIFVTLLEQDDDRTQFVKYAGYISNSIDLFLDNIRSGSQLQLSLQFMEDMSLHFDQIDVKLDVKLKFFDGFEQCSFFDGSYTFSNGSYTFSPQVVKNNIQSLKLSILDTIKQNSKLVNITINFQFSYRDCIPGEIYVSNITSKNFLCGTCPFNTFSSVNNSLKCQDCPENANCINGTLYQLHDGWWRVNFQSNQTIECQYKACSEDRTSEKQCVKGSGSMGPLCESCDIKGQYWGTRFSRASQHKCDICTSSTGPLLIYVLISIMIVASVEIQLMLTFGSNILLCIVRYIRILGFLPLGTSGLFNAGVYVKTILFHFQILSILQGIQKNDVMSQIIEKQNIIGNQAQIFIFASDCIYGTYDLPIPSLAYMDVILSIFYSLLIMTIGLLFSFINLSGSKRPYYRRFIVLYSYWTQIPSIAFFIMAALSCRGILDNYFVKADISQTCLGEVHIFFMSVLLIPTLMLQFISGLYGLYLLRENRKFLNSVKIQTLYGMLFQEYKIDYCYYEIIKLFVKLTLVFLINVLGDSQIIMTSMLTLVLLCYLYFTIKIQPYTYHLTQRIDQSQIIVLILTIQLTSVQQNTSSVYVQLLTLMLIIMINASLSIIIFSHIFVAYTRKLFDLLKIYKRIIKTYPSMINILDRPRNNDLRVFYDWKILRSKVITVCDPSKQNIPVLQYKDNTVLTYYIPYVQDYSVDL